MSNVFFHHGGTEDTEKSLGLNHRVHRGHRVVLVVLLETRNQKLETLTNGQSHCEKRSDEAIL